MTQNFKVGDVVYVKDQDPDGRRPQTITQVITVYDSLYTYAQVAEMRSSVGYSTWRTADRLALHVPPKPTYTIDLNAPDFIRARDSGSKTIVSVHRAVYGFGPETERIRLLHSVAQSLGYVLQDPE